MPGGRPSKFEDIDLDKVKALAVKGWTDIEMADFFDVHIATWYRWKGAHEEFCEALKDWKEDSDARVERSLYERAMGYECKEDKIFNHNGEPLVVPTIKHHAPDTTAAIFWLKNRQPDKWRDKKEIDSNIKVEDLTEDQLDDRLTELLDEPGSSD